MLYTIKKNEIIDFNGIKFKCLVNKLTLSKVISKSQLMELCYDDKLEMLN